MTEPSNDRPVPRVRDVSGRERWLLWIGGLLVAGLIAITVFSLTSSDGHSGNGCLNFTYSMAMGGEQFNECGAKARETCASPPKLGGLANGLLDKLPAECRKAGLPYRTGSS